MLDSPGIYVHFPWCVKKCPYCDFNSHPLKSDTDFNQYASTLLADWRSQADEIDSDVQFKSVFLGGGTPSLFAPEIISTVLSALPLANAEVTMEANPGTTEHANFADYRAAGVNRLSIGAQSFSDSQLQRLGRIHAASETTNAFANARAGGFNNINLDLMWGLPQQTVEEALADLHAAIDLAPEHLSWYQLTIEAKTEFAIRTPLLPVEDTLADIERLGLQLLADAGYVRYEVSAFARQQRQCQHNLNYWAFGDYIGIGAGAHGKISARDRTQQNQRQPSSHLPLVPFRTQKASQPRLYLANAKQTTRSVIEPSALAVEFMMNALRLVEGVSRETLQTNTGLQWASVSSTWARLVEQGLVEVDRCATTPQGLRYLDSVVGAFLTD
jgi:putative oxygen-independent coproporphyrinogen III oxidase